MNTNSGVPTLGVAFLGQVPVPVPPIAEQQEVTAILDSLQSELTAGGKAIAGLVSVKSGILQDLLTGKVRVQVDEEKTIKESVE